MRSYLLKMFLPLGLILAGLGLIFLGPRPLTLLVDGQVVEIHSQGLTVGQALNSVGIHYTSADRITPKPESLLITTSHIKVQHALPVTILGTPASFWSLDSIPANWLQYVGQKLFPGDQVLWNGEVIDPARSIRVAPFYTLQVRRAQSVEILSGGAPFKFGSAAFTLGGALLENGFQVRRSDRLTGPFSQSLDQSISLALQAARPVQVWVDGKTRQGFSAGATVGQVLADLGVSLQGLDFSDPPEEFPLPVDGSIRVVRVQEEIVLQETSLPYQSELQPDPELELDQRNVITPGVPGLKVTRQRLRFEDGQEVSRSAEAEWVARQPQNEILGYGTRVVVRTITTAEGTFEYWRAVNVYATSYSPCQLGIPNYCNSVTASGAQLVKGIVAVRLSWYRYMKGAGVYIPGYGTGIVADVGGGIPGRYWIDLGFTDADFQAWHQNTTIYFLTPVPTNILYILPY